MRTSTSPITAPARSISSWKSRCAATSPTCSKSRRAISSAAAASPPVGRGGPVPADGLPQRRLHACDQRHRPRRLRGGCGQRAPDVRHRTCPGRDLACLSAVRPAGRRPRLCRAPHECTADSANSRPGSSLAAWRSQATRVTTANEEFYRLYQQGVNDLVALRLPLEQDGSTDIVPAAGLPWFAALFGRDSLTVSLQTAPLSTEFARGSLRALGAAQARERDDYARRRARQDPARAAPRRVGAFQADPAHRRITGSATPRRSI